MGWRPGPDDVRQKKQTHPSYDVTHKKTQIQNFSIFLIEATRLSASLEGLNSSLSQLLPSYGLPNLGNVQHCYTLLSNSVIPQKTACAVFRNCLCSGKLCRKLPNSTAKLCCTSENCLCKTSCVKTASENCLCSKCATLPNSVIPQKRSTAKLCYTSEKVKLCYTSEKDCFRVKRKPDEDNKNG